MKMKLGLILTVLAALAAEAKAAVIVNVGVNDRPYYIHGPGYYVGPRYYVWVPGHWRWRHHHRAWIHGYYAVR
jgi:WXXGXW repeat (2 copies)